MFITSAGKFYRKNRQLGVSGRQPQTLESPLHRMESSLKMALPHELASIVPRYESIENMCTI